METKITLINVDFQSTITAAWGKLFLEMKSNHSCRTREVRVLCNEACLSLSAYLENHSRDFIIFCTMTETNIIRKLTKPYPYRDSIPQSFTLPNYDSSNIKT